jgi:hypothetical protein
MKLIDLDPRWLVRDGKRVGFTFTSPAKPEWRQSCFVEKVSKYEQWGLFAQQGFEQTQGCDEKCLWKVDGGIESADFSTISVTPSLDGSKGGLWHGFITNGEIR